MNGNEMKTDFNSTHLLWIVHREKFSVNVDIELKEIYLNRR